MIDSEKYPVRVLHVINGMGSGGAEMMIMNWYRHIDRNKVQFDFLLRSDENIYESEIKKLGGYIYKVSSFPKHFIKNYKETKSFLLNSNYKIIHVHANALIYTSVLKIAKKANIPCRILHSHNTDTQKKLYRPVHYFHRLNIMNYVTDCFACSEAAGKWSFLHNKFKILKNGIDIDKFTFNQETRNNIRKELDLNNKFVIGHVGRFLISKNHEFLINVFKKVHDIDENTILVLIGEGPYEARIKNKVKELKIEDSVLFLGVCKNVNRILNSFDLFVFPSLFEGLGIVAIEAQTNGLTVLASEKIPEDVKVTDNLYFINLYKDLWVEKICDCIQNSSRDLYTKEKIIKSGYDIVTCTKQLEEFYLSKVG